MPEQTQLVYSDLPLLNEGGRKLSDDVAACFQTIAEGLDANLPSTKSLALVLDKLRDANAWVQALIACTPEYRQD